MFFNYLKLALRNLSRQKAFSFINIFGLALGLASSLVIMLWVKDELSFDRFHTKADRTYRLVSHVGDLKAAISPAPFAPAIQELSGDVQHATRVYRIQSAMLQVGDKKFEEKAGYWAEPSFFEVFDFRLLQGDAKTTLKEPTGIVISEAMAVKYFGTTDAIGKTIRKDKDEDFVVTGILAQAPGNSHLRFDFLLPWVKEAVTNDDIRANNWGNFDFYTFITFDRPKDETFIADFEEKLSELFASNEKRVPAKFKLQPITDIHLHSNFMADVPGHGNFQYVAVLSIIAIFIIVIGCINFMNLSTARSARRAKEVGLRKVAGAVRGQLIKQFLGESLVISIASLIIAIVAVIVLLPQVNLLVGKQLRIDFKDPFFLIAAGGITIVTGILSGLYPAFILSGFAPAKVLKKDVRSGVGGSIFRNVLVVSQFVISIVLLVSTTVVYQQLRYVQSKDLGYDKENLIYVNLHGNMWNEIHKWQAAFNAEPLTANASFANALPTDLVSGTGNFTWPGKDPAFKPIFATIFVDEKFTNVYNVEIISGRNFNHNLIGDSTNFLFNETAIKIMGFTNESALGQEIELWGTKGHIVGVVRDFNFKPLRQNVEPMMLPANRWGGTVVVKAEPGKTGETIAAMERVWSANETLYPFSYGFIDQDLENLYRGEKQVGTLFTFFAGLAILISCLGLYGLSAFIAEQRTREIGIRKALGASVLNILYLLNTRFVLPVLIAMIIAAPLAWFTMDKWLSGFAYHVNFNWALVAIAGCAALAISLLTVSYESYKAARINPVKTLRSE
ncbi:MAG TPA: FtsX-like permease family protein [Cyclobacteriaceae bacterium]|nr:FtsX-like permease family protein [Cyclobacteriaceae bacterium]